MLRLFPATVFKLDIRMTSSIYKRPSPIVTITHNLLTMKWLTLLFLSVFASLLYAQETHTLTTEIKEVTVFLKKAQVTRTGSIHLTKGEHTLKLKSISPYVDKRSIQFKANRSVTVLGLNYERIHPEVDVPIAKRDSISVQLEELDAQKKRQEALIEVAQEDISFLLQSRSVLDKEEALSSDEIKNHAAYQNESLTKLKLRIIELNEQIAVMRTKINALHDEQSKLTRRPQIMGEIIVHVDNKRDQTIPLEFTYVTDQASWFPSYDVTVNDLNEPLVLSYKANVIQNTSEDWNDVNLSFSSTNPTISPIAPELKTYYIDYGRKPPTYDSEEVVTDAGGGTGIVLDSSGEPIIGANILVKGTTIGTITDLDGRFNLPKSSTSQVLIISFVGYESQEITRTDRPLRVVLNEGPLLDEVVVTGYGGRNRSPRRKVEQKADESGNARLPVRLKEKITDVKFEIDKLLTVKSNNKPSIITMATMPIEAEYEYRTIPKVNTNAFLFARIKDWEQYNFLEGQMNIILDDTFIGTSLLELSGAKKTLNLSLGVDNSVYVSRQRINDYTNNRILSKAQTASVGWKIKVKNNKSQKIDIYVSDQIPVSTNNGIEVKVDASEGGEIEKSTGTCTWKLSLSPAQQKDVELKYEVKYQKGRTIYIE